MNNCGVSFFVLNIYAVRLILDVNVIECKYCNNVHLLWSYKHRSKSSFAISDMINDTIDNQNHWVTLYWFINRRDVPVTSWDRMYVVVFVWKCQIHWLCIGCQSQQKPFDVSLMIVLTDFYAHTHTNALTSEWELVYHLSAALFPYVIVTYVCVCVFTLCIVMHLFVSKPPSGVLSLFCLYGAVGDSSAHHVCVLTHLYVTLSIINNNGF